MDWKFVLILSLIIMTIDSSLAKRRKVHRTKTLPPACSKCMEEINAEKYNASRLTDRSGNESHPVFIRAFRKSYFPLDLNSSCAVCVKLLKRKEKIINRLKANIYRYQNPRQATPFNQNYEAGLKLLQTSQIPPPHSGSIINYHYHFNISFKSNPGSRPDSTKTSKFRSENREYGSKMANSNFKNTALANEATQVSGATAQSSSEISATGNETTLNSEESTQSISEITATGSEATLTIGETAQSSSEISATNRETSQTGGETAQSISEVSPVGNAQKSGGKPNKPSYLARALAPAPASLFGRRANVNYYYE